MSLAALLPRDPTAVAWWVAPLAAALALSPTPSTAALAGLLLLSSVAIHLARTTWLAGVVAGAVLGGLHLWGADSTELGMALGAMALAMIAHRQELEQPNKTIREIFDMVLLTVLGGWVMVRAGGANDVAGAVGFALVAWHTSSWWTSRTHHSRADHGALIPEWIVWVPMVLLPACLLACNGVGFPWVGLVPFGFPVRAMAHDPLRTPADLPRIGIEDAVWSSAAAIGMVVLAGL